MPPDDASTPDPPPPPIPDYALLRRIGRGSYGDVWLARSATGLYRAVKIVWRSRFGQDDAPYEREFNGLREFARITAGETQQLSLLHVGRNDAQGFFYYIMELADDVLTGREIDPGCYEPLTFRTYREIGKILPIKDVILHAIELARCLAELHSTGHLHRDIKPSNIIVVHGRPKLADIGLIARSDDALTFVGTEGFMPPEGPGTTAADIYSFGKVLYELATGRDRHDFPRLPEDFGNRADHRELLELNEIILRACAQRPEERYVDVNALLADLQLLEAGRSVRRLRRAEAGLARARKWIIAAVTIAAIAGTGAYLERRRAEIETAGRRAAEEQLAALTRRSLYESSIANAQRALASDEFGIARKALALATPKPGEPDLRGFEWYAINREAQGDPARVLREKGARVDNIVVSPNGQFVAIDDASTTVEVYEIESGRLVTRVSGIHRLAGFTPDGERLVGTTPQYEIETWSLAEGVADPSPNTPGTFRPLAVATKKPHLLYFEDSLSDAPHRLAIRDLATAQDIVSWDIPRREDGAVWEFEKASADAELTHIALQTVEGVGRLTRYRIRRWRVDHDRAELVQSLESPNQHFTLLSVSQDGRQWIRGQTDRPATLSDESGNSWAWTGPFPSIDSNSKGLSPDGRWLLLGTRSRKCVVADPKTGAIKISLSGHSDVVSAIAWLPDSTRFLSGSHQGDVRIWSITTPAQTPSETTTPPISTGFSTSRLLLERNSSRLFIPCSPTANYIFDPKDQSLQPITKEIQSALLFEENRIWWIDRDRSLVSGLATDPAPPEPVGFLPAEMRVREASVSPNGRWWTVSGNDNLIVLWDRSVQRIVGSIRTEVATIGLTVDNAGNVIFVDFEQVLQSWNLKEAVPRRVAQRQINFRPTRIIVSPDSLWLILIDANQGNLVLRNPDMSQSIALEGSYSMDGGFDFHPDGRTLACLGALGTVRLFSLNSEGRWSERPPLVLGTSDNIAGRASAERIAFSSDGRALYSHLQNGTLRIWRK